jgi:hypothetical protein
MSEVQIPDMPHHRRIARRVAVEQWVWDDYMRVRGKFVTTNSVLGKLGEGDEPLTRVDLDDGSIFRVLEISKTEFFTSHIRWTDDWCEPTWPLEAVSQVLCDFTDLREHGNCYNLDKQIEISGVEPLGWFQQQWSKYKYGQKKENSRRA